MANRYIITVYNKDIDGVSDRKFTFDTYEPMQPFWSCIQTISEKFYNNKYLLYGVDKVFYNIY